jgi:DNA-directed RNA polymerase specialized sigma24 family protein
MAKAKPATLTRKLSREINTAYEAYKANEPGSEERLMRAFVEQARHIARSRLGDMYDGTVAYDAAHRAMMAVKDFKGKSRLSSWFYRIVQNEMNIERRCFWDLAY